MPAADYFVRGIVRDSLTMEPLPFASIVVEGQNRGAVADDKGIFEIPVPAGTKALRVTCIGYEKKIVPVRRNSFNTYVVYMTPATTELQEITVRRGKYSKKNNPAVDFLNRLKNAAPLTDPRRNDFYAYDRYERLTLGLNNFTAEDHQRMMQKFPFLGEHVDTSAISGKPFLSLMVKERRGRVNWRKATGSTREIVEGIRSRGIDDIADPASMRVFMEDILARWTCIRTISTCFRTVS